MIVATFTDELEPSWIKVLAATSATSVALIKTTDVGRKGNGFRQAHRHLKAANMRRFDIGEKPNQDVIRTFVEAELMIGDVVVAVQDLPEEKIIYHVSLPRKLCKQLLEQII
ncbi:hypothetical protein [Aliterella atlantica]|uniref:Uncharacterized protein n=1 Tax=Aliterella atlantica CENA595 TaxID=1618023 RepID=A0A0D8ZNB3_9CYAN|nr:hypothetical protein [Aliterella atlantica]KJH69847.1 hypothetical protein UH38_21705 [Aliterella atlantica CENA595]